MDYSRYDTETTELMRTCEQLSASGDPEAIINLRKLREIAVGKSDNALIGFADYYAANWYYDVPEHDKFRESLKSAIYHLLRSDERETLARAYNLFAMDAEENETFDVAYHYYQNALRFANEEQSPSAMGVILSNLASLYYIMKDYDAAREYGRRGMALFVDQTDDPYYLHNMLGGYINDVIFSLGIDEFQEAQESFLRAEELHSQINTYIYKEVDLAFRMLKMMILLARRDHDEFNEEFDTLISLLEKSEQVHTHVNMIAIFSDKLFAYGLDECVGRIIGCIKDKIEEMDIAFAKRILSEMEVDYYDRTGDEKKLDESLKVQHEMLEEQNKLKVKIYRYSIELINLLLELRQEQSA